MPSSRLSVRISARLEQQLRQRAAIAGQPESVLVRQALDGYLAASPEELSAYEMAEELGLIGCASGGARDLSTNRKHLAGFGKSR